jgi:hypothetical protein
MGAFMTQSRPNNKNKKRTKGLAFCADCCYCFCYQVETKRNSNQMGCVMAEGTVVKVFPKTSFSGWGAVHDALLGADIGKVYEAPDAQHFAPLVAAKGGGTVNQVGESILIG